MSKSRRTDVNATLSCCNDVGSTSLRRNVPAGLLEQTLFVPSLVRIRWVGDLRFYVRFFQCFRRWEGDNERLCAMEPRLRLERFQLQTCLKPRTARSVGRSKKSSDTRKRETLPIGT